MRPGYRPHRSYLIVVALGPVAHLGAARDVAAPAAVRSGRDDDVPAGTVRGARLAYPAGHACSGGRCWDGCGMRHAHPTRGGLAAHAAGGRWREIPSAADGWRPAVRPPAAGCRIDWLIAPGEAWYRSCLRASVGPLPRRAALGRPCPCVRLVAVLALRRGARDSCDAPPLGGRAPGGGGGGGGGGLGCAGGGGTGALAALAFSCRSRSGEGRPRGGARSLPAAAMG